MGTKTITKDQLIEQRVELDTTVSNLQEEVSNRTYDLDFENVTNVTAVLKQIDKSYTWDIKNAAGVIQLYDALKNAKNEITSSEEATSVVSLNQVDVSTLYHVLTAITGTGIGSARTFAKLLTNIGAQITVALQQVQASNQEVQDAHLELSDLDNQIAALSKETVEADEIS